MAVRVIFKHKWFAPDGSRVKVVNVPVDIADELVPFLPKTAKVLTVEDVKPVVETGPATLSEYEIERAADNSFNAVLAKADAQYEANKERRKRK